MKIKKNVKATKTIVVKPISAKTRKDVTHLLHQTGVLKGGYLLAPADHQYEVTGDLNQLRLSLIQMSLRLLDPTPSAAQVKSIKKQMAHFKKIMKTINPATLKGTMDEIGTLKSVEQVYKKKAHETKKESISAHIKEIDEQMKELRAKKSTLKKTKPHTAKELMWHHIGEHHSTSTPLPSAVFKEELKTVTRKPKTAASEPA